MPATAQTLTAQLRGLGVAPGDLVMVHASLRRLGPVIGGAASVVRALLDAVGEQGTIAAYVDFEPFFEEDERDTPVFDPRTARAALDHGVLHEVIRTWPGAIRSAHPDAGVAAIGPRAAWLTTPHPFQYGYGEGTPFARVAEAGGRVLVLGAPLDTITLLHHAEHLARIPDKRIRRYERLMPAPGGGAAWTAFEEFETAEPVHAGLRDEYFQELAEAYLSGERGRRGPVGLTTAVLLDAADLVAFATRWIEQAVSPLTS